jgi:poly(3-hydroxyalkanoate) synthetase
VLRSIQNAIDAGTFDFAKAVSDEVLAEDTALIGGIAAYRRHPWHRDLEDPPHVWREGSSELRDYGPATAAPAILFVPSLINRAYILDLRSAGSMMRWFASRGTRPLLLDWGEPGELERRFTLTDYVAGRLERAILAATQLTGGPIILAGYCMGGTLAVAAAQRRSDLVRGLVLLAAPWDFHAPSPERAELCATALDFLEPVLQFASALPVDFIQALFALLDPWSVADKYRRFHRLDQNSETARLFVAMEDWLNDGVPLAAPVARACLGEWYGQNLPARNEWSIAGMPVDPRELAMPAFVAIPGRDRIVPPDSASPLGRLLKQARVHQPGAGHIGMAAGPRAERELWLPLLRWVDLEFGSGASV